MSFNIFIMLATGILSSMSWFAVYYAVRANVRAQSAKREAQRLGDRVAEVAAAMEADAPKRLAEARVNLDNVLPYHAGPYRSGEATGDTPADFKPTFATYLRYMNALQAIATLEQDGTAQRIARQALGKSIAESW